MLRPEPGCLAGRLCESLPRRLASHTESLTDAVPRHPSVASFPDPSAQVVIDLVADRLDPWQVSQERLVVYALPRGSRALRPGGPVFDDISAERHAVVADVNAGPSDQCFDVARGPVAKRAAVHARPSLSQESPDKVGRQGLPDKPPGRYRIKNPADFPDHPELSSHPLNTLDGMTFGCVSSEGKLGVRLAAVEADLRRAVADLDSDTLAGPDAAALVDRFVRIERLAASAKSLCASRVEASGAWKTDGDRSAAGWLARRSGTQVTKAADELATGRRINNGPSEVRDAYRDGQLSAPAASAIATAAEASPDSAGVLLQRAGRDSLHELKDACRAVHAASNGSALAEERMRRLHQARYLRRWIDVDGAGRIDARLAPAAYARFNAAMRPFEKEIFDEARGQGRRERPEAYSADALVAMANEADHAQDLADIDSDSAGAGADPDNAKADIDPDNAKAGAGPGATDSRAGAGAGTPNGTPDSGTGSSLTEGASKTRTKARNRRRRRKRPADAQIIYLVDYNKLTNDGNPGEETYWLEGVGPVPLSTVEAMKADAVLSAVVTDGIDIRSVVHLGRCATAAQHTAIIARDRCCVVPGCGARLGLEIDHVTGWTNTHETKLDDLARLCHHHHHQKTYEHWTLAGGPGHWEFNPPNQLRSAGAHSPPAGAVQRGSPPAGSAETQACETPTPHDGDSPNRLF